MEPSEGNQAENTPVVENPIEPEAEPIQAEDNTAVAETVVPPAAEKTPEVKPVKKTLWDKLFPYIIVALVSFLGGLLAFYFVAYQPKMEAYKADSETATAKIESLTKDFNQALGQYRDSQTALDLTKGELTAVQSSYEDQSNELILANQLKTVYKFLADINAARIVLEKQDANSVKQAITFAKADLAQLQESGIDPNAIAGFSSLLDEADKNLTEPGLIKSRAALDTLYNNLLLLMNNLP